MKLLHMICTKPLVQLRNCSMKECLNRWYLWGQPQFVWGSQNICKGNLDIWLFIMTVCGQAIVLLPMWEVECVMWLESCGASHLSLA